MRALFILAETPNMTDESTILVQLIRDSLTPAAATERLSSSSVKGKGCLISTDRDRDWIVRPFCASAGRKLSDILLPSRLVSGSNCLRCLSVSLLGVFSTVHITGEVQGGAVSDPLYLKSTQN